MAGVWALAALWLGLALIASLLSIWLRVSTAQNLRRLAKLLCRAPPPLGAACLA